MSDFHALNKNDSSFAYNVMYGNIWYERLGHVNKNTKKCMINLDLIPKFNFDFSNNCEVRVLAK